MALGEPLHGRQQIAICVCTCKRPIMLRECLEAISRVEIPNGISAHIIVIDNEADPNNHPIAEAAGAHYAHEARQGISQARNRAIVEALRFDPAFIAYVDDDSVPEREWLVALLDAQARYRADVMQSRIVLTFPGKLPFWAPYQQGQPSTAFVECEFREKKSAATSGTMFSSRLVRADGLGLRFNERIGLSGGEDADFFARAHRRGAKIIWTSRAIINEQMHVSRMTYFRYISKGLAFGAQRVIAERERYNFRYILLRHGKDAVARSLQGIGQLVIAPFFAPFSLHRFKFTALEGGRNLCVAAGIIGGFFSMQYAYYRRIDGQ